MFDKHIRKFIFIAWILVFIGLWFILEFGLSQNSLTQKIDSLQENISQGNWQVAT